MRLRASELRARDVINVTDGRRLGTLYDLDIDLQTGRVRALILPGPGRGRWFWARERDLEIPWSDVVKVGVDVILVELPSHVSLRPVSRAPTP